VLRLQGDRAPGRSAAMSALGPLQRLREEGGQVPSMPEQHRKIRGRVRGLMSAASLGSSELGIAQGR